MFVQFLEYLDHWQFNCKRK